MYIMGPNNVSELFSIMSGNESVSSIDNLIKKVDENDTLRSKLESQLQDLYGLKNPRLLESEYYISNYVQANLVWTVLVTCSLYLLLAKYFTSV